MLEKIKFYIVTIKESDSDLVNKFSGKQDWDEKNLSMGTAGTHDITYR